MSTYELGKTGMHTMPQIRRQVQLLVEQQERNIGQSMHDVLVMELLLHIYDGLDIMDTRLRDIEGHLSSIASSEANREWDAEHNPHAHGS